MVIILDGGHGGTDSGAVGNGLLEKNITLTLAKQTRDYLQDLFVCDTKLTRSTDKTLSLKQRIDIEHNNEARLFYSFHVNSSKRGVGDGFESYIYKKLSSKTKTYKLQEIIHGYIVDAVMKKYQIRDRGKKKEDFYVLRETRTHAILGEYLFINNPEEANLLKDASFINELALATAQGIGMALKLKRKTGDSVSIAPQPKKAATSQNKASDEVLYIVKAGAFKNQANAQKRLMDLKNKGFSDAYISKE